MSDRELIEVVLRGYESKDVDYKGSTEWNENDKKSCCSLVKDILGMANTNGGFIVIGVAEKRVGLGFSFDGVSDQQSATFDTTRVNRFLQNYSDPPVNALLKKVSIEGKTFVIIQVPTFPDTPHICQKDYPGVLAAHSLYVRTDNNETAPVRSSADFRAVLERAIRNRSDALLTSFRSILVGGKQDALSVNPAAWDRFLGQRADAVAEFETVNPLSAKGYNGYLEAAFFPDQFEEYRFTLDQLRDAAQRASSNFRGWPFLFISSNRPKETYAIQNGIETLISFNDFGNNDRLDFWRFQQSGFFYQRTLMWEDSQARTKDSGQVAADFGLISVYCAEAIHCLTRLYEGLLPEDERVFVIIRILGTQGRELISFDPRRFLSGPYISRIPLIEVKQSHPLADWRAGIVDYAVEMSKEIFSRFNWPNANSQTIRDIIERMFGRESY